jgi:surface carbohydrate biosynthesis protein
MRIFNNIKIFFYIILFTKFKFTRPKKVEILFYDQGIITNPIIRQCLKNYKASVLKARFEELNLYVILKIVFKFKFLNGLSLFQNYVIEYCKLSDAKMIISSSLFDKKVLVLKKYLNKKTLIILFQIFPLNKNYFKSFNKKYTIDHFFIFDNKSLKIIKKYFISKYTKIGSLRNNTVNIKKNKRKNKNILLISGFRENFVTQNPTNEWELNIHHEKKVIGILSKIYIKNSKFKVLLKPFFKNKQIYLNFMKCDKKILISNDGNPYTQISKFDIVITLNNGTMGYEALSRGIKHLQIPQKKFKHSNNFYVFDKEINYSNLKKFIIFYSNITNKKFFQIYRKKKLETFIFDYGNSILKSCLNKNLISTNTFKENSS